MQAKAHLSNLLIALASAALATPVIADEALLNFGKGPQPGAEQRHTTAGIDYSFYRFERSPRQHILVGVSYTRLDANVETDSSIYAISVYPQLSFYPTGTSRIASRLPDGVQPFFFVRALGPSYISASAVGDRQQAGRFSFQAQIGAGVLLGQSGNRKAILTVSWKHFSNADLYSDNDGIDVPLVISFGLTF